MGQDAEEQVTIPHPRGLPLLGDAMTFMGKDASIMLICEMASQYGEIFSLKLLGQRYCFVSSQRLLKELCDESRFEKVVVADLEILRAGAKDGLFTARAGERNWEIAHRVLVPAFGPLNVQNMFDSMKDVASQLVLKWLRHGPSHRIAAASDFTRLTLDTLALCAMDYRFNSFYSERMHAFVEAMVQFLKLSEIRGSTPALFRAFGMGNQKKWTESIQYMRDLSRELVQERRKNPRDTKDLLNAMIIGKDPITGEHMTEESVIDNVITFLVAGHETTSGALSFVFYYLVKHPSILRRAQQEVDDVIGDAGVQSEHLSKLPYVTAILRESLRLQPTAPAFTFGAKAKEGEVLAGKYFIPHGQPIHALLYNVHRDQDIYGASAEEFDPDRMMDGRFEELPPGSWKPFGNGSRGCIGRPFAWQEMVLVVAMLLRYFDFTPADPDYTLQVATTLTVKPKDFFMKAELRSKWTAVEVEKDMLGVHGSPRAELPHNEQLQVNGTTSSKRAGLAILYGSNSGTCEAFARTLAGDAADHGFSVTTIDTLNSAVEHLPKADEPLIIITASYEGQPCDNAAEFFRWLKGLNGTGNIANSFAVFGCGHSDWRSSLYRIPTAIDALFEATGGRRICRMGTADAAKGDMMSEFHSWQDQCLWPSLKQSTEQDSPDESEQNPVDNVRLTVELVEEQASMPPRGVPTATVIGASSLTAAAVPEKRHLSLQLAPDITYRTGDYCAIVPSNPSKLVNAVMARFDLPDQSTIKLSSVSPTFLPLERPISARELFTSYVELSQPATKRNIRMLMSATQDESIKSELETLLNDRFQEGITDQRVSLLHLLQRYPTIQLPVASYISTLMPMLARLYSISSSPLKSSTCASLTYSVLHEAAKSGDGEHIGVASNYLARLQSGDMVEATIRSSHFRLPEDPAKTPVIMIAAGTGIAPFRGFVEERSAQIKRGQKLAHAVLYYGCHHPEEDDLYRAEMSAWEAAGVVSVKRAYSRAADRSNGMVHIDEVVRADSATFARLWRDGARIYVCGSRGLGISVKAAVFDVVGNLANSQKQAVSEQARDAWFDEVCRERYVADVFD